MYNKERTTNNGRQKKVWVTLVIGDVTKNTFFHDNASEPVGHSVPCWQPHFQLVTVFLINRSQAFLSQQQTLVSLLFNTRPYTSCYSASLPYRRSAAESTTGVPLTHMLSARNLLAAVHRAPRQATCIINGF